jgi:hypothetical protein
MTVHTSGAAPAEPLPEPLGPPPPDGMPREFPVREYIGAMSIELAQMARWDGDEALARLLDAAGAMAAEPLKRRPSDIIKPRRPRRA